MIPSFRRISNLHVYIVYAKSFCLNFGLAAESGTINVSVSSRIRYKTNMFMSDTSAQGLVAAAGYGPWRAPGAGVDP